MTQDVVNRNPASETVRATSVASIFIRFWQGKFDSLGCADNIATETVRIATKFHKLSFRVKSSQVSRSVEPTALEHSGSVNH